MSIRSLGTFLIGLINRLEVSEKYWKKKLFEDSDIVLQRKKSRSKGIFFFFQCIIPWQGRRNNWIAQKCMIDYGVLNLCQNVRIYSCTLYLLYDNYLLAEIRKKLTQVTDIVKSHINNQGKRYHSESVIEHHYSRPVSSSIGLLSSS